MDTFQPNRFVRVPSKLLDALLNVPLNGTQWRILLWVIRQTYGWNRDTVPFSWYRIARYLSVDRGGVVKAGNKLLQATVLYKQGDRLGIQKEYERWDGRLRARKRDGPG